MLTTLPVKKLTSELLQENIRISVYKVKTEVVLQSFVHNNTKFKFNYDYGWKYPVNNITVIKTVLTYENNTFSVTPTLLKFVSSKSHTIIIY